jgi:hypothetical protein
VPAPPGWEVSKQTIMPGLECRWAQTQERLCWRGPSAIVAADSLSEGKGESSVGAQLSKGNGI